MILRTRRCPFVLVVALTLGVAGESIADDIVVTANSADVKSAQQVIARASQGERYEVKQTNGAWYHVDVIVGGEIVTGWIHRDQVRLERAQSAKGSTARATESKLTAAQQARLNEATDLNEKVEELYKRGKSRDAVVSGKRALAIRKEILGERHSETAASLNNLGVVLAAVGDYAAARPCFEQALAIRKEVVGENDTYFAKLQSNLGRVFEELDNYRSAERCYEQALTIYLSNKDPLAHGTRADLDRVVVGSTRRRQNDEELLNMARKLSREANGLALKGRWLEAAPLVHKSFELRRQVHGDSHPALIRPYQELAVLLSSSPLKYSKPEQTTSFFNGFLRGVLGVLEYFNGLLDLATIRRR